MGGSFSIGDETPLKSSNLDLGRLTLAIAQHETGFFTTGVGVTHNNGCGIRRNGAFERYETPEESLIDCTEVLNRHYEGMTVEQIAQYWTTTQREEWINNVTYFYNKSI
jgi:hypothetical protein|tara:strand:+ start:340 stop:666 length:327 start_codon:yes stop_codon:yes gene_type:complete